MKLILLVCSILLIIVSCSRPGESSTNQPNDNLLVNDWIGFDSIHIGGGQFKYLYTMSDFRITNDSLYQMKYPTRRLTQYALTTVGDSLYLDNNEELKKCHWSLTDSILTLIGFNAQSKGFPDTTIYYRTKFENDNFKRIRSKGINTSLLEKFIWNFDYNNTSSIGWKSMDTNIYNPPKELNLNPENYTFNKPLGLIIESDTFKIIEFQKIFFMSDTNRYLLMLEKEINNEKIILYYMNR